MATGHWVILRASQAFKKTRHPVKPFWTTAQAWANDRMLRSDWARDGVAIYARGDINMGADSVHIAPINLAFTWNLEMDQIAFGTDSFAENPEPRVPCVLLLDVSSSMAGERIQTLNDGVRVFRDELVGDSLAAKRVETAIVTFGQEVKSVCDFVTAENFYPPTLEPSGATPMGEGLNLAIDMLEERKRTYKANGISYYRPWVFLISDGAPNDPCWEAAARRAVDGDRNKSFAMFAVGVQDADMEVLKKFSNRAPLALKGLQFREMFLWLSSSLKSVSRSTPGEDVPLQNPTGPSGWATV